MNLFRLNQFANLAKLLKLGWGILFIVLLIVVMSSAYRSYQAAEQKWRDESYRTADKATQIFSGWLLQQQDIAMSVAAAYIASNEVTRAEFFELVEFVEYSWEQNLTVDVAHAKYDKKTEQIVVLASSIVDSAMHVGRRLDLIPEVKEAVNDALVQDRFVLSAPILLKGGERAALLIRATSENDSEFELIFSLIRLDSLLDNLLDMYSEEGISLDVLINKKGRKIQLGFGSREENYAHKIELRELILGSEWQLIWRIYPGFSGGPDMQNAVLILSLGGLLLLVITVFIALLVIKIEQLSSESKRRKNVEIELKNLAHFDVVTGLPNRFSLLEALSLRLASIDPSNDSVAVCFIDLDDFKFVNDRYGHDAGDVVLRKIAERFKSVLRKDDILGRIGGDEFVLIIDVNNLQEVKKTLARIQEFFQEGIYVNEYVVRCGCSIGVALYPDCGMEPEILLRHADQAMFSAKQSGKGKVVFFNSGVDKVIREQKEKFEQTRQAIKKEQLELYFQPKINLKDCKVYGAEGLIRWNHPEDGLVFPNDFLPFIEDSAVDIELGYYVLRKAMQQLSAWQKQGINLELSINISTASFQDKEFSKKVKRIISEYPDYVVGSLQFEILESILISNMDIVQSNMSACLDMGISFALDDFGTGFSSLSYLKDIKAQVIKIDKSFVMSLEREESSFEIIKSIIELAKIFGREVIAEGVETQRHGEILIEAGCHYGQGYYVAKPMQADEFQEWLLRNQEKLE